MLKLADVCAVTEDSCDGTKAQAGSDTKEKDLEIVARSIRDLLLSNKGFTNIENLAACAQLEKVDLSKNLISTADGLSCCLNIKWLNMSQNRLLSAEFVAGMSRLTVLNLGHNLLTDMSPMGSLHNLRALILNNNNLECCDGLQKLKHLNTLVLSHNRLTVFESAGSLSSLVKLQLAHNRLRTFPNVKYNLKLKNLLLNDNKIKKVSEDCVSDSNSKLELVDLGRNSIQKFKSLEVLSSVPSISNVSFTGNPVCEREGYINKTISLFRRLKTLDAMPVYKRLQKLSTTQAHTSHPESESETTISDHEGNKSSKASTSGKKKRKHASNEEDVKGNSNDIVHSTKRSKVINHKPDISSGLHTDVAIRDLKQSVIASSPKTIDNSLRKTKKIAVSDKEQSLNQPAKVATGSWQAEVPRDICEDNEVQELLITNSEDVRFRKKSQKGVSAVENSKKSGVLKIIEKRQKKSDKQPVDIETVFKMTDIIGSGKGWT